MAQCLALISALSPAAGHYEAEAGELRTGYAAEVEVWRAEHGETSLGREIQLLRQQLDSLNSKQ